MPEERRCRECGTPIPWEGRGGVCPRCLLGLGLSTGTEAAANAGSVEGQPLAPGEKARYFGDYELLEEIARGGMGVVWRARQVSLDRLVALKLILAGELASEAAIERFHREAQAAANLDHPNIVPIYEVGEHAGCHYFTMRLVEGQSVAQRLARSGCEKPQADAGPLAGKAWLPGSSGDRPREAAKLLVKIARAVHHAHQRGVLHRDLKPGNILLDAAGEPHITDFGLAKHIDAPEQMTRSETVVGTCNFMSPEQARGRNNELTTATDIYSLGAVFYHLLTGHPPFEAPTSWETLQQVVEREPPRPSALNGLVDRDLETICLKCLEKDPQRRYASADALANDLERWLRQEPILARPSSNWEHLSKWTRRKPAVAALIGALATVAILGMLAVLWYARQANRARLRAEGSEAAARERLWNSYLTQARALRLSGRPGRRFDSLAAISNAAAMHPTPELRREAIACLGLCDVQMRRRWRLEPKPPPLWGVAFDSTFERYARAHPNGDLSLHRINDDVELARLPGMGQCDGTALCFSPNGRFLAEAQHGPSTNYFRVWDLDRRAPVVWAPYAISGAAIGFAADSSIVAAGEPGALHLHDLGSGQEINRIPVALRPNVLGLDASQRRLAVCGNGNSEIQIFDSATGSLLKKLAHPSEVTWLAWSPDDSTLACSCMDKRLYLWNALSGDRLSTLEGHTGCVVGVAFNRGGDLLISSSWDGSTRFWNPATGEQLLSVPVDFARFVPFSADDRQLGLLESDDLPSVWAVATGGECRRWPGPSTLGATFCAGGRVLIGIAPDGVRFWDAADGRLLGSLPVGHCASVLLQPDGRSLWLSSPSGLLRFSLEFDPLRLRSSSGPPNACGNPLWVRHHSVWTAKRLPPPARTGLRFSS